MCRLRSAILFISRVRVFCLLNFEGRVPLCNISLESCMLAKGRRSRPADLPLLQEVKKVKVYVVKSGKIGISLFVQIATGVFLACHYTPEVSLLYRQCATSSQTIRSCAA